MRDPFLGTVLDRRFRVDERIGIGGFGVIYRATHVKSKYPVALKVLNPVMSRDERIVARFKREAATVTSLRSPHTVTTYELVEVDDGTLFMVMELLRGETLLHRFRREGALPWRKVVAIGRAVCESLAEAHGLGVVHRDLKPENIHLEPSPEPDFVKVLDFGIAKVLRGSELDGASDELTKHNEVVGTFDYVSPEQIMGEAYSGRSDIYTLGVVLYEMVTGTRPFAHATGAALLAAIVTTPPTPPSVQTPGIPAALDAVLLKCLEHEPQRRYHDVGELAAELDVLLDGQDDGATRNMVVGDIPRRAPNLRATDEEHHEETTLVADRPIRDEVSHETELPTIADGVSRRAREQRNADPDTPLPTLPSTAPPPVPVRPTSGRAASPHVGDSSSNLPRRTGTQPPPIGESSSSLPRRTGTQPPPIPRMTAQGAAVRTPPPELRHQLQRSPPGLRPPDDATRAPSSMLPSQLPQPPAPPYATPAAGGIPAFPTAAPFAPGAFQPPAISPGQLAQQQQQHPGPGAPRTFSTLEGWGAPPKTNPGVAPRSETPEPAQTSPRVVMWIIVFAAALVVGVLLAVLA